MNENSWLGKRFTNKLWTDTLSYVQGGRYGAIDEQDTRLPATQCPYHQRCFVWQHMWNGDERSADGEALHKECLDHVVQNTKIIDGIGSPPPDFRGTRSMNNYFVGSYDNFKFPYCSHQIRKYKWVQTPRITINYALQEQKTTQSENACRTTLNPYKQTNYSMWSVHYTNCMEAKGYQRNDSNKWTPMPHLCP